MILAIDPGLSGAYAVLDGTTLIMAADLPRFGDKASVRLNAALFATVVEMFKPCEAVTEAVSAMPGQGVSSMFRFGRACGAIEGVLAALDVPIHYVAPGKWKRRYGIPGKPQGGDEIARQRAIEFWPGKADLFKRKMDHGRADAALLGRYFAESEGVPRKGVAEGAVE